MTLQDGLLVEVSRMRTDLIVNDRRVVDARASGNVKRSAGKKRESEGAGTGV